MRSIWALVFCVACSVDHAGLIGSDGGAPLDIEAPLLDAGFEDARADGGSRPDVPPPLDAGRDVPLPVDGGMPDTPVVVLDAPPMMDSGPDVPPDAGCPVGEVECDGDTLRECTGAGWIPQLCELECREGGGGASCYDLAPSNLARPLSEAMHGDAIVRDALWDTDNCRFLPNFWYVDDSGELELCVVSFNDVTFQTDLRVVGSRGLVIVAKGNITLEAEIRADAQASIPGPGGTSGADAASGIGYSGGNGASRGVPGFTFRSDGGGGGGGGVDEGGEGGSAGGGGGSMEAAGGSRGPEFGDRDRLIPLRGSGGGGSGGGFGGGLGGGGGGTIQFSARGNILVRDSVNVSGGGGSGGTSGGGGGGGGAGGSVHFECAGEIRFEGSNEVLAAGGGGGGGGGCSTVSGNGNEEESGGTEGGVGGGNCPTGSGDTLVVTTRGGNGSADARGGSAPDISLAGGNAGGGGGSGGFVVIRADEEMGSLAGSGHRRSEDPEIVAVD
ncbi:MAG: hypothetical protein AB8H86_13170 [Polyangiales bacterium]